ncbi:MAG: hypothetical protein LUD24_02660 [Phascolarctobacterium sp.]|nr:hypothetical protein [Phascolarctobacterium sp.]
MKGLPPKYGSSRVAVLGLQLITAGLSLFLQRRAISALVFTTVERAHLNGFCFALGNFYVKEWIS